MAFQIDYLADHIAAIADLAHWHHTEWVSITPNLTMDERAAQSFRRFQAPRLEFAPPLKGDVRSILIAIA